MLSIDETPSFNPSVDQLRRELFIESRKVLDTCGVLSNGNGATHAPSRNSARSRLAARIAEMESDHLLGKPISSERIAGLAQTARMVGDRLGQAKILILQNACEGSHRGTPGLRELEWAVEVFDAAGLEVWTQRARIAVVQRLNQGGQLGASVAALSRLCASTRLDDDIRVRIQSISARTHLAVGAFSSAVHHLGMAIQTLLGPDNASAPLARSQAVQDCQVALVGLHLAANGRPTGLFPLASAPHLGSVGDLSGRVRQLVPLVNGLVQADTDGDVQAQTIDALYCATFSPAEAAIRRKLTRAIARLTLSEQASDPQAWLLLGLAFRLAGNDPTAVRCQREALRYADVKVNRGIALQVHAELSILHESMGSFQEALSAARAIIDLLDERQSERREAIFEEVARCGAPARAPAMPALIQTTSVVDRAMTEIRTHIRSIGGVNQVASRCGVSRRTLEVAFKEQVGCTVATQIRLQRVEAVLGALARQIAPLASIASEFGYSSVSSMSKEVKRQTGRSPREWRAVPRNLLGSVVQTLQ